MKCSRCNGTGVFDKRAIIDSIAEIPDEDMEWILYHYPELKRRLRAALLPQEERDTN